MVVSLEMMNRILEIDKKNMVVVVEPGVINGYLQERLEGEGLFYPPDPSSLNFCTIGGNVAENAGGPRALKYGVTRDYVLGLEVVLPDARVMMTGGKNYKTVSGYDLTSLMVGSEGTLGIVTKVILKVLPLPEEVLTMICLFDSIHDAADAINKINTSSVVPRCLEIIDSECIRAVESYKPCGLPQNVEAIILIEIDGESVSVKRQAETVAAICEASRGTVNIADDIYSRQRLWSARRSISPALYHLKPDKINEDIVVPRGRILELIRGIRDISLRNEVLIACFGHAGDGNIHVNIMADRNKIEEWERATKAVEEVFKLTVSLGGSISGEHGIGLTKKPYLHMELPEINIEIMKKIKKIIDPYEIMNQ
jgi:glycolate oxidase